MEVPREVQRHRHGIELGVGGGHDHLAEGGWPSHLMVVSVVLTLAGGWHLRHVVGRGRALDGRLLDGHHL